MKLDIYQKSGKKSAKKVTLNEEVFGITPNKHCVYLAVSSEMASIRQGTHSSKTRAEVSGSGAKPWRQKGTGRARAGTIRSPIWRSGGVSFAAKPQDHSQKVNRKMYRGAIKSILSELVRQERLIVVESFALAAPKTKELVAKLKELELKDVLIVTEEVDENLFLSARNLYKVDTRDVAGIDPVSLIAFDKVLITAAAVKQLEEALA